MLRSCPTIIDLPHDGFFISKGLTFVKAATYWTFSELYNHETNICTEMVSACYKYSQVSSETLIIGQVFFKIKISFSGYLANDF